MKKQTSIKARIMRLCVLSVITVIVALMAAIVVMVYKAYETSYRDQAESLASAYCQMFRNNIENLRLNIKSVQSRTDVLDESISLEERKAKLADLASTSNIKDFSVAYGDGTTYNNTDLTEREYFQTAMKGSYAISAPVVRLTDNSITTMLAGPVYTYNDKQYVIYGSIDTLYFSSGLDTSSMTEGSNIIVMDKHGQIVAASDTSLVMSLANYTSADHKEYNALANEMLSKDEGFMKYIINGVDYISAFKAIPDTDGWKIAVNENYSGVKASILTDILICAGISVILIAIGITVVIAVSNKLVKPVIKNTKRLKLLSEGDVTTPFVNDSPRDETYILSESMVSTVETLRLYINDIRDVLSALAEGNLTVSSTLEYKGDFVEIGKSLNQICSALKSEMSEIKNGTVSMKDGAKQVAAGAQALSQTALEEAQAVSDISSTVAKINEQAENTAQISEKVAQLTLKTNENAKSGGELMAELLAAVENIREKSNAIGNIIKTISDIAFQTNILSLNASIEAARAGEAGKGFSVVASEVSALAAKSQLAVENTEALIKDSLDAVNNGTDIANRASAEMTTIVEDISRVAEEIALINSAAVEQKDSITLINENMTKIEAVMQSTTATAEESAASGEQLSAMSSNLADTVGKYITE